MDVDVAPLEAEETPDGGAMLQLSLKNQCEERVGIDVRAMQVTLDGRPAKPFDPRHELRPAHLGELAQASERIIYLGRRVDTPDRLCVTLGAMVDGVDERGERCFVRDENGWSRP